MTAERRRLAKQIANITDDLYPVLESAITGKSGLEGSDPDNPNGVKGKPRATSLLDSVPSGGSADMTEAEQEHIRKVSLRGAKCGWSALISSVSPR